MRPPSALPDELAGLSFTLEQQVQAGVPAGRAWRNDLRVASHGVRVPWGAAQPLHHTCALPSAMTPDAVCCLATAALLWDCPLPLTLQLDLKIHLAKASGGARLVRKGIAGHRLALRQQDVSMLDGVPVTGPARTWLDLEPRQRESDISRDESIAAIGWQSVTVTAGHVRTWGYDGCAHRVLDALVRAGWRIEG